MSDIWSRAWCQTTQIPNFHLKGITPLNEERRPPGYVPRVFSTPTQFGTADNQSPSPSPEPEERLCFGFRNVLEQISEHRRKKKSGRRQVLPASLQPAKRRTAAEKIPHFKSPAQPAPGYGTKVDRPGFTTPPVSPGRVRVCKTLSRTPSTTTSRGSYYATPPSSPRTTQISTDRGPICPSRNSSSLSLQPPPTPMMDRGTPRFPAKTGVAQSKANPLTQNNDRNCSTFANTSNRLEIATPGASGSGSNVLAGQNSSRTTAGGGPKGAVAPSSPEQRGRAGNGRPAQPQMTGDPRKKSAPALGGSKSQLLQVPRVAEPNNPQRLTVPDGVGESRPASASSAMANKATPSPNKSRRVTHPSPASSQRLMGQSSDPHPPGVNPSLLPIGPDSWSSLSIPANLNRPPPPADTMAAMGRMGGSSQLGPLAPPSTTLTQITHLSPAPRVKKQLTRKNLAQLERQQQQQAAQMAHNSGGESATALNGQHGPASNIRMEMFLSKEQEMAKARSALDVSLEMGRAPVRPQRSQNHNNQHVGTGEAQRKISERVANSGDPQATTNLRNGHGPSHMNGGGHMAFDPSATANYAKQQQQQQQALKKGGVAISSPALSWGPGGPSPLPPQQADYESILFVAKDGTIIAESRNVIRPSSMVLVGSAARSNPTLSASYGGGLSTSRPSIMGSSKSVKMIRTVTPQGQQYQQQLSPSNNSKPAAAVQRGQHQNMAAAASESRLTVAASDGGGAPAAASGSSSNVNVWHQLQAISRRLELMRSRGELDGSEQASRGATAAAKRIADPALPPCYPLTREEVQMMSQ